MLTAVTITTLLLAVLPVRAYNGLPYHIFQEEPVPQVSESMGKITGRIESLQSANGLMFAYIKNNDGRTLGRITELVFDRNQGNVYCVVISSQAKHHPVPWTALEVTPDSIKLDIKKTSFNQSPAVDRIDLAQLASQDCRDKINSFYSAQIEKNASINENLMASFVAAEKPDLCTLSDLKKVSIQNLKDEELGGLRNLVIDTRQGNVAYGLVGFGGFMRIGEKVAAVPWSSLMIQPDKITARVDADRQTLEKAVIDAITLDKLAQPQFAREVHQNFGMEPYWEVLGFVPPGEKAANQPRIEYTESFNPDTIAVIECTVKSVGEFTPAGSDVALVKLDVETRDAKMMAVHCGPQEYISRMGFDFKPGALITVTGAMTRIDNKEVITATTIKVADKTLILRDNTGTPQW